MILCAPVADSAIPGPQLLREVLPPALFSAFQFYLRQLSLTDAMSWEQWGHRRVRHNDPIARLLYDALTRPVEGVVGRVVKPSYVFLACYEEGGRVPPHRDREQCRYTLDLCVTQEGPAWPLHVEGAPYFLAPNEALVYRGSELTHHREEKPSGTLAHLAFFHFVDVEYEGPLD